MAELKEYKCPCCGGAIAFDSGLQKMKCPYCDTEFEMETLAGYDEDLQNDAAEDNMSWDESAGGEWSDGEADNMNLFVCKSCGGEIVADENTAATSCPFCGNPVVMTGRVSGMLKPDIIIPFKLDKEAAKKSLNQHFSGKKLLPKVFKEQNHIDEVKGVYVPYWVFDTLADGMFRYKGTRVRKWSSGNYDYTETSYFSIIRSGCLEFASVPVDGSSKMPDELMESLEPYDMSQAVKFQSAYLAGYLADKYDVDSKQSIERANERIKKSTEDNFRNTISGYVTVNTESGSVHCMNGRTRYALYPVWLLNTTWNGQKYTFAMNGQTGKFVGDLPIDKSLKNKFFFGIAAGVAAAVFAVEYLIWLL